MIFLKWEEPVEPNGLITQYEVRMLPTLLDALQSSSSKHLLQSSQVHPPGPHILLDVEGSDWCRLGQQEQCHRH